MRLILGCLVAATLASTAASYASTSDDEKGPARRAYRAECVKFEPAGYCECITAGFAQDLTVRELGLARAAVRYNHVSSGARNQANFALIKAFPDLDERQSTLTRINALESELQQSCGTP